MKAIGTSLSLILYSLVCDLKGSAFEESLRWDNFILKKSGESSVRILKFIKVFDAAFYLEEERKPSDFPGDFPYALTVRYERNVKRTSLIRSADRILEDLHKRDLLNEIRENLEEINSYYQDVQQGDSYTLLYRPGKGTTLLLNKIPQVTIPGKKFAEIYFSIWLGDHPDTKSLRKDLLEN
jgi:hypothetical protein